ncbi:MAG TPA: alpha/beta hydrolase, partial [Microbacterium sp.]|nr:alpha/beta hydrolase [Microbacterium sp.]
ERVDTNDLRALIALAGGMRFGDEDVGLGDPPQQAILIATGSNDGLLAESQEVARGLPHGHFVEIPGRHHFNAPGSRDFRGPGVAFLKEGVD